MSLPWWAWLLIALQAPYLIFGNPEDGWDGDASLQKGETGLWPDKPEWQRVILWTLRNPFHSLCFHLLGFTHYPSRWVGRFDGIFASDDPKGKNATWNFGVTLLFGVLPFPLVTCDSKILGRGGLGWRKGGALMVRPPLRGSLIAIVALAAFWGLREAFG